MIAMIGGQTSPLRYNVERSHPLRAGRPGQALTELLNTELGGPRNIVGTFARQVGCCDYPHEERCALFSVRRIEILSAANFLKVEAQLGR